MQGCHKPLVCIKKQNSACKLTVVEKHTPPPQVGLDTTMGAGLVGFARVRTELPAGGGLAELLASPRGSGC